VLPITRKRSPVKHTYTLRAHPLTTVPSTKYLGVTISADLQWKNHITQVCNKANQVLGFLRRNLKISSVETKSLAYTSLVRPLLEYASVVWDPHQVSDIRQVEMVQRRAARYVTGSLRNRSSVSAMVQRLNWEPLEERRRAARLTMMYKMVHGHVHLNTESRLVRPARRSRYATEHSFQIPAAKTDCRKWSFFPRTIREWNALPANTVSAESLNAFKALLTA